MKHLIAAAFTLAALAGPPAAGAQTPPATDPAHPLASPQAPAPDCRSDSVRGAGPPCGPSKRIEPNGAQGAQRQSK
ncbi:MAG: hypothetical protein JO328_05295 [Hyphomicrobiales bacterium]|nr:hypothetical protein [Hyphomicrobiales bacterium]MBV8823582.1 hypothetical protein [Hyphomicrobiales bacterium]MBV9429740.1 hypothetical protein [Bradyrhizobiaceae bacterium]